MCMFFIKESIWQRCQIFHMTSWLSEQAVYLSLCPTNISVKLSILCFSSVAQGCLGDTGPTDRVPGLHRLRFTHYPPDRSDTWHHSRAAFHFHGHPVLTRIPVGQEGNQSCPPGCLLDVDTINCTFPVFLLLASHALPPPSFITSCQTADVIDHYAAWGGVYRSGWGHIYPCLSSQAFPSLIPQTPCR